MDIFILIGVTRGNPVHIHRMDIAVSFQRIHSTDSLDLSAKGSFKFWPFGPDEFEIIILPA